MLPVLSKCWRGYEHDSDSYECDFHFRLLSNVDFLSTTVREKLPRSVEDEMGLSWWWILIIIVILSLLIIVILLLLGVFGGPRWGWW